MKSVRWAAAFAVALLLTACAYPTPFQPATPDGMNGYIVTQVETNRFRLSFNGNNITPRHVVDNDMIYLAAQVTLRNGGDWFELTQDSADKTTSYPTYLDPGPAPYGPFGWGGWGGWGGGWGGWGGYSTDFSQPQNAWDQHAEIIIHHGQKPPNALHAYDARDVVAHVQSLIQRGAPGPY